MLLDLLKALLLGAELHRNRRQLLYSGLLRSLSALKFRSAP